MDTAVIVKTALDAGASAAVVVDATKIPFDAGLRLFCEQNACGNYGRSYSCPPYAGEAEELIRKASGYKIGVLVQTIGQLEDSLDYEGMMACADRHGAISRKVFDEAAKTGSEYLCLGAGTCRLCEKCAMRTNEPCRFPDRRVTSLEAYCVNVRTLCEGYGLKYINGQDTVTYYSMVLFR